jgi:hypothetical protein
MLRPDDDDAFPPPPKSIRRGTNKASSKQPEQVGSRQAAAAVGSATSATVRVWREERERESGTIPIPPARREPRG